MRLPDRSGQDSGFGLAFSASGAAPARAGQFCAPEGVPLLAGPDRDVVLHGTVTRREDAFTVVESVDVVVGWASIPAPAHVAKVARSTYDALLRLTAGRHLYRIWNFVPRINAVEADLENYRAFCVGRAEAFEARFGQDYHRHLPAASAVGTQGDALVIAFIAGATTPTHFENPAQTPAFRYPPEHGPRSPSFARATRIESPSFSRIFISGTSSIRDHHSVGPGNLDAQLDCTLENLRLIGAQCDATSETAAPPWRRFIRVYLRHAADLPRTQAALARALVRDGDIVQYLQADICRAELLVEIEITLTR